MRYKLTEKDYMEMYPLLTPSEIREEFGSRSKTSRAIHMLYEKYGLRPVREERRETFLKYLSSADIKYSAGEFAAYTTEQMFIKREEIKKRVWLRIRDYEGATDGTGDS